jgi:arylsulfatase A-like enzyme/Flp pilus assembly protein TadD
MSRRPLILLALLAALGCHRSPEGPYKNAPVILISIDTLRSDHLPAYGYKKVATPAIDGFARDAVLYERAYSHYPLTLPSHVSILTGELPPVHRVRDNAGYPFDAERHSFLPRLLKQAGYDTGGAVSAFVLRAETGIGTPGKGFDFYDSDLKPKPGESLDSVQRPGAETAARALEWIRSRGKGGKKHPFFFFLHLYEPHAPYEAPEPFASRYSDPYDAEIATADSVVGSFLGELKRLGIYDKAVIVLLSDHGEGLGDHGEGQHGLFLYRETLQVPLMLKLPGQALGGTRVAAPAELVDVTPTLLSLAGVDVPKALLGTPLLALRDAKAPARQLYAETFYPRLHFGWSDLASLIEDHHHYIEGPAPELYDLGADPGERRNLLPEERRTYATLRAAMKGYDRRLAPPGSVDAETARKLAALGYIGGSAVDRKGPLPDPKSQKAVIQDLERAFEAMQQGRHAEAVEVFGRVLAANPNMQDVWAFQAASLQKLGRDEEAAVAYEKALELSGGSPQIALATATKLLELGRLDDAQARAELALKQDPASAYELLARIAEARKDPAAAMAVMRKAVAEGHASEGLRRQLALALAANGQSGEAIAILQPLAQTGEPPTLNALGIALSDAGRQDEAAEVLRRSLEKDPKNAHAYENLGIVALRQSRPQEARDQLRRAIAINDKLPIAWNTLGVALYQTGEPAAALPAWQKAVRLDPGQFDALFNLGLVAAELGQRDEARRALRQFVATAPPARFAADIEKARGALREIGG